MMTKEALLMEFMWAENWCLQSYSMVKYHDIDLKLLINGKRCSQPACYSATKHTVNQNLVSTFIISLVFAQFFKPFLEQSQFCFG